MAARRGSFRSSLRPFGGGQIDLDAAYRVAPPPPATPEPPDVDPIEVTPPNAPPPPPGVVPVKPIKAKPVKAKPVKGKPVKGKPKVVAKPKIVPKAKRPIVVGAKKALPGRGAVRPASPRPIPKPPSRSRIL